MRIDNHNFGNEGAFRLIAILGEKKYELSGRQGVTADIAASGPAQQS